MRNTIILGVVGICIVSLFIWSSHSLAKQASGKIDSLRFSNTMQWDPTLLDLVQQKTYYIQNWKDAIALPPPPTNTSDQTKSELATLLADKTLRTPEKVQEIQAQADIHTAIFNGHVMSDYFDPQ